MTSGRGQSQEQDGASGFLSPGWGLRLAVAVSLERLL